MKKSILPVILLFAIIISASGQVKYYRQLPEIPLSQVFKVEVRQGKNHFMPLFTYSLPVTERVLVTKSEHITMFGFEPEAGPAEIRITNAAGQKLDKSTIELVNRMYGGISVSFSDGAMLIKVNRPKKQLFIRLKDDPANPLNIFADPLAETSLPTDARVVRFAASTRPYVQENQYDRFTVPNDVDVVYIEDGALIKGTIHTDAGRSKPLRIMGQGMVIGNGGILHGPSNIPYNAVVATKGIGNSIEGITVMKSRHFSMDIGEEGHIDNVKLFGYAYNNDGIVAGKNSLIENSFFKVNDDHVKLYNDSITVRNCVFYVQTNGAVLQFAWNRVNPGDHCLVEDCEVVAVEYQGCGDPLEGDGGLAHCFISLREEEADGNALINTTIRNILIQGQLLRFMGINGHSYKGIDVDNLVIENVNVLLPPAMYSWIYTKAPYTARIFFKNVIFGDRPAAASDFKTGGNVTLSFDGLNQPYNGKIKEYED
ncbi:MAG: hypothetical protein IH592_10155 [Bacteroidales bacterium]|nr:hypothetical protein [Bacteroidales bacterium]